MADETTAAVSPSRWGLALFAGDIASDSEMRVNARTGLWSKCRRDTLCPGRLTHGAIRRQLDAEGSRMTNLLHDPIIHALIDSGHDDHARYPIAADRAEDLGFPRVAQTLRWLGVGTIEISRTGDKGWCVMFETTASREWVEATGLNGWLLASYSIRSHRSWRRALLSLLTVALQADSGVAHWVIAPPPYRNATSGPKGEWRVRELLHKSHLKVEEERSQRWGE